MTRTYRQYSGVARALEIVGERWTLLLVRELLLGPRRFADLLAGLPGIGTNMLSARLKALEEADVVRRAKLPPPAGSTVYELTESGRHLEGALMALERWGLWRLGRPRRGEERKARWLLLGIKAVFDAAAVGGIDASYEFRVGEEVLWASVREHQLDVGTGPARMPDAIFSCELKTFTALATGETELAAEMQSGRLQAEGDPAVLLRAAQLFGESPAERTSSERGKGSAARPGRAVAGALASRR